MNIDSLKMFCLVVEEGSISQAARLAYVSQPAVTRQIHQLENFYGTLLFDRTEGRLTVTEIGRILYPFAKSIVGDFHQSKEVVKQATGSYNSNLGVGASFTIGEYLLPVLLGQFKKSYMDINVMLTISNTPNVIEELSNDLIDLALVEGIVDHKNFIVEKFAEDELVLVCPAEHSWKDRLEINIEELASEKMIWREPVSGTRLIVESTLKDFHVLDKLNNYMELGSTQAIKSAVEAGLGISILSRFSVVRELEQGFIREVKIKGIDLKRNLWIVRKPKRFNKVCTTNFLDFIKMNKNL